MDSSLTRLRTHALKFLPALGLVALMIVWTVHDGGYDPSTWYWGALLLLAGLAALVIARGARMASSATKLAILALALFAAWSFLSITWAGSPGDALQGSNRVLLYLIVFVLASLLPWTVESALAALVTFAGAIGVLAVVLLFRLAAADRVGNLIVNGRLLAPTGYFNATAALFTLAALVSIALAAQRRFPGLLRGALIAFATADLQLAVLGESRGWLFTLPLVLLVGIVVVRDRLRVALTAVLPVAAIVFSLHPLLAVYRAHLDGSVIHAAAHAGRVSLVVCLVIFVAATLLAWGDQVVKVSAPSRGRRRLLGMSIAIIALVVALGGAEAATHGKPVAFVKRQWQGFSHPPVGRSHSESYFGVVGSGRYDFWRVSLDAFASHPIGGLGQDNFADYYVKHRRTIEEPAWTHSLEMRLLAHTGIVGFALFAVFVAAAIAAALRARRGDGELGRSVATVALLPLVVWLVHGSVDWFWEMPALTAPALAFLAVAGALGAPPQRGHAPSPRWSRALAWSGAAAALIAAVIALGLPYLSARQTSAALTVRQHDPARALSELASAARLNPASAAPARLGGAIALQTGRFREAQQRFEQAIAREPGGWFSWLGAGLAASALGDPARAHHDFRVAISINSQQPAVRHALARVYSRHPLTATQAMNQLVLAG